MPDQEPWRADRKGNSSWPRGPPSSGVGLVATACAGLSGLKRILDLIYGPNRDDQEVRTSLIIAPTTLEHHNPQDGL